MDFEILQHLRQHHPAWRLLGADHAALILGFFEAAFVRPNRRSIPAPELIAQLDAYIAHLDETGAPGRFPKPPREYLDDWAAPERGFLRKYYPRIGEEAEFDLTPAAEKAVAWIEGLTPQTFVGTESRLLTLFELLRELATGAQADPVARVRELERRRAEIDAEIERVRRGQSGPLDSTAVRERYFQIEDLARRLLGDFRQVEENFRVLDRATRERIAGSVQPKGVLLDEIFGETDHIRGSDQGKSFEAFWEFLMSPSRQEELRDWLAAVHALPAVDAAGTSVVVQRIPWLLLDAGEKVHATVRQLVEQLRRFVDDQAHLENRRILDLVAAIEQHAVRMKNDPPREPAFAALDEATPEFPLPMCRTLFRPPRETHLTTGNAVEGSAELDLAALLSQTSVDEQVLRDHIGELLRVRPQVTLAELAAAFPPQQGLAEIVGYLRIASSGEAASVDDSVTETIELPARDERHARRLRMPRVIFTR